MWHQDSFVIWPSASWASFHSDPLWKPSNLILLTHSEIASSLLTSDLKMYIACSQLLLNIFWINWLHRWFSSKESACQSWRHRRCRFNPWVRKIPWRRKWHPTSILAWRIPGMVEPGGLPSTGLLRVRYDWSDLAAAAAASILAWRIPWTEDLGRLPSMGSKRVEH